MLATIGADYVAAACFLVGAGLSLFLLAASLVRGVRTSPTQFAYYGIATICCAITLRYVMMYGADSKPKVSF